MRGRVLQEGRLLYSADEVNVYDEIDDVRVHEVLATGLPDLDAFATAVAQLAS